MNKLLIIGAVATLSLASCSEQQEKTETAEVVETKQPEVVTLTAEEKTFISNKLEEFKQLKSDLNKTDMSDGAKIGELNRQISSIESFPQWFSKNTQEIRHIKLIKTFTVDLGNGLATKNDQLVNLANEDFEKFTMELENMLKK
jgi:hypothetical protein